MFGIVHEEKELPCINMSMKLQGYLLGYDVLQGGVIVKSHRYSVPVKNLVVNTGKDFLMKVSNSPTTTVNESLTTSVPRFGYSSAGASGVLAIVVVDLLALLPPLPILHLGLKSAI